MNISDIDRRNIIKILAEFKNASTTLSHCNRDFAEWHKGISHYGFWAIVVDDQSWIRLFETAQAHIKPFILAGYNRAPHITISACGLLDKEYFSDELLNNQYHKFKGSNISQFSLHTTSLNSFTSAPHLNIEYSAPLHNLRKLATNISQEDAFYEYRPHVTIGLYRDAFSTDEVTKHLQNFQYPSIKAMKVTKLSFCAYETCNIQGPFQILRQIDLRD